MRTDDLICMMAKTPPCCTHKRNRRIWASVALLFAAFVAIVGVTLHYRPDLYTVLDNGPMLFKYALLAAVAAGSGFAWWFSGHPGCCAKMSTYALAFLGVLLGGAAIKAAMGMPMAALKAEVFNYTALFCVGFIAFFSVIGSFVLTKIAGCMAPLNCRLHATMTALFATSMGALAYGLHCQHDNPAYLALWYGGTTLVVTLASLPVLMKKQAW